MNYIWSGLIIISFIFSLLNGNTAQTLTSGLNGAMSAPEVLLSFAGIMCFWSGMLKVAQECGAAEKCSRLLAPVVRRLFPNTADRSSISMNIIANLLGMGNAATPAGLDAMRRLDSANGSSPYPSRDMCRFAVLNTAGLQIMPTTVIGILSAAGSQNPYAVIPYIWISSVISLAAALTADKLLHLKRRGEK